MWTPVEERTDRQMVHAAAARARVRLRSGKQGALVRWPSSHGHHSGRYARLQTSSGKAFTVHVNEVAEVWREDADGAG
jgi:hypothetical protein